MAKIITVYEKAIAGYLEQKLDRARVRLWADAFSSNDQARVTSQVFFGLQAADYSNPVFDLAVGKQVWAKTLKFEVQALIHNLRDHQAALDLMDAAIEILDGYKPYVEFEPLAPIRYGSPRRNNQDGSWTYSGEMRSVVFSNVQKLTTLDKIFDPQIIGVGLINLAASPALQLDRTW